jgi:transposase-like protein
MKRAASEPERMNEAEGAALVEEWQRSGLGITEFARRRGVQSYKVSYWKRRLEKTGGKNRGSGGFLVVSAGDVPKTSDREIRETLEIVVNERFTVRVPAGLADSGQVLKMLKEVEA